MKRGLILLVLLLLGACVLQQARPVGDEMQNTEPQAAECAAPKSGTVELQEVPQPVTATPLGELDSPLSPEEGYEYALELIAAGKYEAAATELMRVIKVDPGYAKAHYALGFAYLKLGEYEDSVLYFTRSQASAQDSTMEGKALVARGYSLHILGRYSAAIRAYGVALQIAPNNAKALYNRGCSYGEMGETAKAIADFKRVLELVPDYPGARNNLKFYSGGM